MFHEPVGRKAFLATLGKAGAGACMCAAAAGMQAAFGGQAAAAKPGDKTNARAAKRMEFVDGWVRRFFEAMDQTLDEDSRRKLMMANGRSCFAAYAGPPKKLPAPDALEKFSAWIAAQGKEKGYSIDGKIISFEFVGSAETGQASPEKVCLCPTAEAQEAGKISPTYCLCSVGYVKEMHERMLGRPVEVELADSVLRGGKRCQFRMTVA
jgi:hypothetical protein